MRIDRLRLQNFKGFEDRVFEFGRSAGSSPGGNGSFHLVIGENGKGKTSALDGLAVAAGSWFLGVRGKDSRMIEAQDVRAKVLEFGDTARIEQQFPVVVEATGQVMGDTLRWRREMSAPLMDTTQTDAQNIKEWAARSVLKMQKGEAVTLPLISYYGTGRLWQEPERKDPPFAFSELVAMAKPPFQVEETANTANDLVQAFSSRLVAYRTGVDAGCSPKDL